MLLAGLTGGVGSGKSTVADALATRGAVIVDTDVIARQVVASDQPCWKKIVDCFGPGVVNADGSINRGALGDLVFSDVDKRRDLEAIVHPEIRRVAMAEIAKYESTDRVVVVVVPLLVESKGGYPVDVVITVDCDPETAIPRLVQTRGWTRDQAQDRIRAQIDRAERNAASDFVLDNSGDLDSLMNQVDSLWLELLRR